MATETVSPPRGSMRGVLLSTLSGGLVASAANVIIGLAALAAGGDPTVSGLMIPAQISLSIVGVLAGAIGWAIVRRLAKKPARVLSILVPIVFVVSLVPLVGLAVMSGTAAGLTAAVGLGIMHLVTIVIAIPVYRRFLPLTAQGS